MTLLEAMKADGDACNARMAEWGRCDNVSNKYNPMQKPTDRQRMILQHIAHGRNTYAALRDTMGMTRKALRLEIDALTEARYITSAHEVGNRITLIHSLTQRGAMLVRAKK